MEFENKSKNTLIYKTNIYIYLSLLTNSYILDIVHSPYYIALGSPQTHKVI